MERDRISIGLTEDLPPSVKKIAEEMKHGLAKNFRAEIQGTRVVLSWTYTDWESSEEKDIEIYLLVTDIVRI